MCGENLAALNTREIGIFLVFVVTKVVRVPLGIRTETSIAIQALELCFLIGFDGVSVPNMPLKIRLAREGMPTRVARVVATTGSTCLAGSVFAAKVILQGIGGDVPPETA